MERLEILRQRLNRLYGELEAATADRWEPGRQEVQEEIRWTEAEIAKWENHIRKGGV